MTLSIQSERFEIEEGFEISLQVPTAHTAQLLEAIYRTDTLRYGDYDRVSFTTAPGLQRFRSLPGGRNAASETVLEVQCEELSFFVGSQEQVMEVVQTVHDHHPYEEPVIVVRTVQRSLHRSGMDEDNPNKFWNRGPEDWVPEIHRNQSGDTNT
ncbi:hypothetical protein ACGYLI_16920 [Sulfitobacter sp. 1A13421]|uniref:hypothetical protein n=1 Tax=Sulfitobacter sp. 1A13421 TaxID=3368595 RepID=UPI003746326F